jgi:hypothetical protein
MTNVEGRMTKEAPNPKSGTRMRFWHFDLRPSFVIRHSTFVILGSPWQLPPETP